MIEVQNGWRKEIKFTPGYDKRGEDYAIHGMHLTFYLAREVNSQELALELSINMMWYPSTVRGKNYGWSTLGHCQGDAHSIGLHVHSSIPLTEDQEAMDGCHLLDGRCYLKELGSSAAQSLFELFVDQGEEGLWPWLQNRFLEQEKIFQQMVEDQARYS